MHMQEMTGSTPSTSAQRDFPGCATHACCLVQCGAPCLVHAWIAASCEAFALPAVRVTLHGGHAMVCACAGHEHDTCWCLPTHQPWCCRCLLGLMLRVGQVHLQCMPELIPLQPVAACIIGCVPTAARSYSAFVSPVNVVVASRAQNTIPECIRLILER
jgi:hypothetical protein